ncbi:MAG: flagellar biosynthesis protein FlhF [Planctomycetes bacterium]|nr:flagellar biosynthesis protein FlhF [Planctomycetota bacterium]
MKLKTFRAKTMAEALSRVKKEFGRDAVILNTRTVASRGVLGFGGPPCVEITAARDHAALPPPARRTIVVGGLQETDKADGAAEHVSRVDRPRRRTASNTVVAELRELRVVVSELARESHRAHMPDLPESLFDSYRCLVQNDVAEEIARDLVVRVRRALSPAELNSPDMVRKKLASLVEKMVPTSGPICCGSTDGPVVIALIGPTGVGKTTTVAKLAAEFSLRRSKRVALITIDTYRIAATEQLKTYADIIDVPLDVASTPEEYRDSIERFSDRDVILIDTAGRSQRDESKLRELHAVFRMVRPDEIHLVVSGTASESVMTQTVERFQDFAVDRVIVTKLDEAIGFGVILNCLNKASARLSYFTTGQDVPDDIEVGCGSMLADLMLRSGAETRLVGLSP